MNWKRSEHVKDSEAQEIDPKAESQGDGLFQWACMKLILSGAHSCRG